MAVARPDLITAAAQIITDVADDEFSYLIFAAPVPCHPYRRCGRIRPLYAFRMIMSDFCRPLGDFPCSLKIVEQPSCRCDSHSRSIAPAVVRPTLAVMQPSIKPAAVSGIRVFSPPLVHHIYDEILCRFFIFYHAHAAGAHQSFRDSNCHNAVICESRSPVKEREVLCLIAPVKFVRAAYHIS